MSQRDRIAERFRQRYSQPVSAAAAAVEREAIGGNFGASGYTTVAQAEALAKRLELSPGVRLLDIGAGRGWPGLYLAAASATSRSSLPPRVRRLSGSARRTRAPRSRPSKPASCAAPCLSPSGRKARGLC